MSEPIQAISQGNYILATQQEVSHDNSLSGNGTVYSPLGVVPGYNETVLWSGSTTGSASLSESITGFERVKVSFGYNANGNNITEFQVSQVSGGINCPLTVSPTFSNGYASVYTQSWKFSDTTTFTTAFKCKEWAGNTSNVTSRDAGNMTVKCIWGINRIAGGN